MASLSLTSGIWWMPCTNFVKNVGIKNSPGSGIFCYGKFRVFDNCRGATGNTASLFFKKNLRTSVPSVFGRLSWVSKPGWILCLHASSPTFNSFLRLTSGVTPAYLLTASIVVKPVFTWVKTEMV